MGKDNIAMGVPIENLVEGEGRKWEDLVEEGKRQCSNCSSSFSSSSSSDDWTLLLDTGRGVNEPS